jgi:hypothetical protein
LATATVRRRRVTGSKKRYLIVVLTLTVVGLPSAAAIRDRAAGSDSAATAAGPALAGIGADNAAGAADAKATAAKPAASLPRDVEGLREAAAAASRELESATRQWTKQTERAKQAKAAAAAGRDEAGKAAVVATSAREELGVIAAAQYRSPDPGWALALSDDPSVALREAEALSRIASLQTARVEELVAQQSRAEQLARKAADLAKSAEAEAAQLAAQRKALMRRADEITKGLTAALERLEEQRRASRAAERSKVPGCSPKDGYQSYPNGLVPSDALCPLPQDGHRLRADAAIAFWQLNDAFRADFGRSICMTDSYRSLAMQRDLYYRKPGLAAVPGTSNHGWGLAVDLCGGAESFGTKVYRWLDENGEEFGWENPSWARPWGSNPEPWHWEYEPGVRNLG